jgi:hypothetical protein
LRAQIAADMIGAIGRSVDHRSLLDFYDKPPNPRRRISRARRAFGKCLDVAAPGRPSEDFMALFQKTSRGILFSRMNFLEIRPARQKASATP